MKEQVKTESKSHWYKDLSDQVQNNLHIIDEYYDPGFTKFISHYLIDYFKHYYFRPRYIGFENFPKRNNPERPLILASNHSGMAFPWDAIMLTEGINEMTSYNKDSVRPLTSPMLSESRLMNPFLYENIWKIVGSVDASFLNFETMLHQNEKNLLIYPEGVPGIGKGFDKRYQLQRFSSSFITMSIKYKTDIIPIYSVNGEYINPLAYSWPWLNRLVNKIGIPYIPIGLATPFLFLQPWFFYSAFPAKLTYVLGRRIKAYEMTDKDIDELSLEELDVIRNRIREEMQAGLNEAVKEYGSSPYHWLEFIKVTFKNITKFPFPYPFGWPFSFSEFKRHWKKYKETRPFKMRFWQLFPILLRDPFLIFYFIPVIGWIPIFIKGVVNVRKKLK